MKIASLSGLTYDAIFPLKDTGYSSDYLYTLNNSSDQQHIFFSLQLIKLKSRFVKKWENTKDNEVFYNKLIKEGHSFAALKGNDLVGMIICQKRKWNNTLYIEHITVAESKRNKGIGSLLIKKIIAYSLEKNYLLVELETQNTNVPAINFYEKNGFKITGSNSMLY